MGITSTVIAQAIKGVISARLVRKICINCQTIYQPDDSEKRIWGDRPLPKNFMKGNGCDQCLHTGYLGRTGLFEIVSFDEDIQASIIEKKSASSMYSLLKDKHIISLREAAYQKIFDGITTIPEVIRILGFSMVAS
jgi:general secretion pathway protein E